MKFSLSDSFVCCRLHRISYYVGMKHSRRWGSIIESDYPHLSVLRLRVELRTCRVPFRLTFNLTEIYSNVIEARKSPRMNSCVSSICPKCIQYSTFHIVFFVAHSQVHNLFCDDFFFLFSIICFWNFNFPSILTCLHSNHCWSID